MPASPGAEGPGLLLKDKFVDSELVLAYASTNQLGALEEFLASPNGADVTVVGERCFEEGNYEAAKVLFTQASSWGRLASTLVKMQQFQAAVDAARKANSPKTWKEICEPRLLGASTLARAVGG